MRFSQGIHDVANARLVTRTAAFAHFKYHAGFDEKTRGGKALPQIEVSQT